MSELSRLRWLCRRGMKELDVILSRYLESTYINASTEEQQSFRHLLEMPDPDLYSLLLGRATSPDAAINQLITKLKSPPH